MLKNYIKTPSKQIGFIKCTLQLKKENIFLVQCDLWWDLSYVDDNTHHPVVKKNIIFILNQGPEGVMQK